MSNGEKKTVTPPHRYILFPQQSTQSQIFLRLKFVHSHLNFFYDTYFPSSVI